MKFEFQNLGTIKKTTLDLRPLTVIVGPNNTSKTYLAYCVHGLVQSLHYLVALRMLDGNATISLEIAQLSQRVQEIANERANAFSRGLPEYFQDTYGGLFESTNVAIQVDDRDVRLALPRLKLRQVEALRVVDQRVLVAWQSSGRNAKADVLNDVAVNTVPGLAGEPLTLPAERNAFIITYKMLSARRFRILRDRERFFGQRRRTSAEHEARTRELALLREQGDIRYPAPIEEFLDFLTDVELNAARQLNGSQSPFGRLAQSIEKHLQAGHRTAFETTKLGGRELAVTISADLRLDLYNASSSIKQVAPLLLYLRYRAAPNQILIIDEPEMNLHPEGQAKLLEALGMLANLGVRVLLTTHSPYFMAHLNNLIAGDHASAARRKRQAKHLYMGDPAAFLSPDDVSAYEMRTDGLHSLADPEYGIRWDTLSDVSSELQRRYFAISEEPKSRAKAK